MNTNFLIYSVITTIAALNVMSAVMMTKYKDNHFYSLLNILCTFILVGKILFDSLKGVLE